MLAPAAGVAGEILGGGLAAKAERRSVRDVQHVCSRNARAMIRTLLALATAALVTVACDADDEPLLAETCLPLTYVAPSPDYAARNLADVTAAELDGDCLTLTGTYGGGCVPDDLVVEATGGIDLTASPTYWIHLYDQADDPCERIESGTTTVSIAPLLEGTPSLHLRFPGNDTLSFFVPYP